MAVYMMTSYTLFIYPINKQKFSGSERAYPLSIRFTKP